MIPTNSTTAVSSNFVLSSGRKIGNKLSPNILPMRNLFIAALSLSLAAQAQALILDVDFSRDTSGFFTDPTFGAIRQATVRDAANTWTQYIDLPGLTAIGKSGGTGVYYGMNALRDTSYDANTLPAMSAGRITIFAGSNDWNATNPISGNPSYVNGFTARAFENQNNNLTVARERGLGTDRANRLPQDGFTLSFNSAQSWVNSKTDPLPADKYDLYTVALAHIGNMLQGEIGAGVGGVTRVTGNATAVFNEAIGLAVVTGPNITLALQTYGGDGYAIGARGIPLENYGFGQEFVQSDYIDAQGNALSALSGLFPGNAQLRPSVVAMDAIFKAGTRRLEPGQYDIALLTDLGFTPVPEPSTYALMGLGLGVVIFVTRRKKKTS